ncbi:MAG: hypothetical protein NC548_58180 [Lachnospiraceae bacterium]|nr:hypothetical protein [Lachnospiraceae bacterium]
MEKIRVFDEIVIDKVYRKCIDSGYTNYSDIATLLGKSDSFARAVFSVRRKKLNLYHLVRLTYELHCSIDCFLPNSNDYRGKYALDSEYESFLNSIGEV